MNFYDKLHEMYKYFIQSVPESYYKGVRLNCFNEEIFFIKDEKYSLSLNELFGKEFFYIMYEGQYSRIPVSMALSKEIAMKNLTTVGYHTNKDEILKQLLVHDKEPTTCVYLYNNHIIYDDVAQHVDEFTKDMLFNISTTFSDLRLDSIRFLLDVNDNDKLEYICVQHVN